MNFERLYYLSKNMTPDEVVEFEEILAEPIEKNEQNLEKILRVFNDNFIFPEVMFGVVHLIETWPPEIYVRTLLKHLHSFLKAAPSWVDVLFSAILNNEEYTLILQNNVGLTNKRDLIKLFEIVAEDSENHKKVVKNLIDKM